MSERALVLCKHHSAVATTPVCYQHPASSQHKTQHHEGCYRGKPILAQPDPIHHVTVGPCHSGQQVSGGHVTVGPCHSGQQVSGGHVTVEAMSQRASCQWWPCVRVGQKISIVSTLSSGTWTLWDPTTACLEHSCRSLEWNVVQSLLNAELCGTASALLFS